MEATKSATPPATRSFSVVLDFLMLAGASLLAGVLTAAVAAACVILLSGAADAAPEPAEAPPPATVHALGMTADAGLE